MRFLVCMCLKRHDGISDSLSGLGGCICWLAIDSSRSKISLNYSKPHPIHPYDMVLMSRRPTRDVHLYFLCVVWWCPSLGWDGMGWDGSFFFFFVRLRDFSPPTSCTDQHRRRGPSCQPTNPTPTLSREQIEGRIDMGWIRARNDRQRQKSAHENHDQSTWAVRLGNGIWVKVYTNNLILIWTM